MLRINKMNNEFLTKFKITFAAINFSVVPLASCLWYQNQVFPLLSRSYRITAKVIRFPLVTQTFNSISPMNSVNAVHHFFCIASIWDTLWHTVMVGPMYEIRCFGILVASSISSAETFTMFLGTSDRGKKERSSGRANSSSKDSILKLAGREGIWKVTF